MASEQHIAELEEDIRKADNAIEDLATQLQAAQAEVDLLAGTVGRLHKREKALREALAGATSELKWEWEDEWGTNPLTVQRTEEPSD